MVKSRLVDGKMHLPKKNKQVYDYFLHKIFPQLCSQTYLIDRQTADSGATATALMTGIKAKYYSIGVDGRSQFGNCSSIKDAKVDGMVNWSKYAGLSDYIYGFHLMSKSLINNEFRNIQEQKTPCKSTNKHKCFSYDF